MDKEIKQALATIWKRLKEMPKPMKIMSGCLAAAVTLCMFSVVIATVVTFTFCTSCSDSNIQEAQASPATFTNPAPHTTKSLPILTEEQIAASITDKYIPNHSGSQFNRIKTTSDDHQSVTILQQTQANSKNNVLIILDVSNSRGTLRYTGRLLLVFNWIYDSWVLDERSIRNVSFVRNPEGGFPSSLTKRSSSLPPLNLQEASEIMAGFNGFLSRLENPRSTESRRIIQGRAGRSISFLEKNRLPASYILGLDSWDQASPNQRASYAARALMGSHKNLSAQDKQIALRSLRQSCKSTTKSADYASKVFSTTSKAAPSDRADYVYRACSFKNYRFVRIRQMPRDISFSEMWLSFAILNHLKTQGNGTLHRSEERLLKAMLTGR